MIELSRRGLLTGLGAIIAAPAIVRVTSIMPVKVIEPAERMMIITPGHVAEIDLRPGAVNWVLEWRGHEFSFPREQLALDLQQRLLEGACPPVILKRIED